MHVKNMDKKGSFQQACRFQDSSFYPDKTKLDDPVPLMGFYDTIKKMGLSIDPDHGFQIGNQFPVTQGPDFRNPCP
jgi:hypothetical protein